MELPDEIVAELLALGSVALAHEELTDALREICRIAERAVPNADGASMTTFDVAGPVAVASSNGWAERLDELQYAEHEGPCIDASRTGAVFRIRDCAAEPRWPSYMPRAIGEGAASMVSSPMTVEAKTVGALNVYSRQADAFDAESVSVAEIIAGHAALATQVAATLHEHRTLASELRLAMASRATVEQAKGIIMSAVGCDPDEAFARLVHQSQHENRKLRDIAAELVRQQRRDRPSPRDAT